MKALEVFPKVLRGRPFEKFQSLEGFEGDGGWGGVWVISNIFWGEKIYLARRYLEKKYPALKKELCISARVMAAGIKSHTVVCPEV